jgi:hypothetical protein
MFRAVPLICIGRFVSLALPNFVRPIVTTDHTPVIAAVGYLVFAEPGHVYSCPSVAMKCSIRATPMQARSSGVCAA